MSWRSALTAILAVILLTASSLAAVCDAACVVGASHHDCHLSSASSHRTPKVHVHCQHIKRHNVLEVSSFSSGCTHVFCAQPGNAGIPVKVLQADQVKWAAIHPIADLEESAMPVRYLSDSPPPDVPGSPYPLTVALRI